MKHGKRPTRRQIEALTQAKLNPSDWLVVKSLAGELHLEHRFSSKTTKIITA